MFVLGGSRGRLAGTRIRPVAIAPCNASEAQKAPSQSAGSDFGFMDRLRQSSPAL